MRQSTRWLATASGALLLLLVFPADRFAGTVQAERSLASLVHYTVCAPSNQVVSAGEMRLDRQLVQNRLTGGFGIAHSRVTRSGTRCLRVTIPARKQQKAIVRSVGQAGVIALTNGGKQFLRTGTRVRLVCRRAGCVSGASVGTTNLGASPPRLRVVVPMRDMARGSAYLSRDSAGQSTVIYSLTAGGGRAWCTFTTRHVDFYSALVVDNKVLSDPAIQGAICGGQTQITGMAGRLTARKIVAFINNGPLPVPLHIVSSV
jgi:preprotein translocase subunit SecD